MKSILVPVLVVVAAALYFYNARPPQHFPMMKSGRKLAPIDNFTILYEFSFPNFTWRSVEDYEEWWNGGGNTCCYMTGMKVSHKGDIYVSLPRKRTNAPATLAKLVNTDSGILFEPYPTWEWNTLGEADKLQSVMGFEIDNQDRLWALDTGRTLGNAGLPGSLKLVIFDTNTGGVVQSYVFPPEIASPNNSWLNDIVIDRFTGFAYITDTGLPVDPNGDVIAGIIVYDFNTNTARRVLNAVNSVQPNPDVWVTIWGPPVVPVDPTSAAMLGADGIALTPDANLLVYCPLTSRSMFAIPTYVLRNFSTPQEVINESVRFWFNKTSASDGLGFGNDWNLYATAIENSSVWGIDPAYPEYHTVIMDDPTTIVWPDTLGFDHKGNLLLMQSNAENFYLKTLNFNGSINYRIFSAYVGCGSYMDPVN